MKKFIGLVIISSLLSCTEDKAITQLQKGIWQAELTVQDEKILPFNFEVLSDGTLVVYNADEEILVDEISYANDSVTIKMPVYEGYLKAKVGENTLKGDFIKESLDRVVPFNATFNEERRFIPKNLPVNYDITGEWEVVFSPDTEDEYIAKGIFNQDENRRITGTFRTTTGDYRYLEGIMDGALLRLSVFDGAHAFLFEAYMATEKMAGTFYSGNHFQEPFHAIRNSNFELPNENELTFLKEGYETLEFSFPDLNDSIISLKDEQFKNEVVIVQIMGSWCPNCLDESKYYSDYFDNNPNKDLEFVAIAFEYAKTKKKAINSLRRLKEKIGINYPILLAQYGTSDKKKAQEKLPMLNHVLSYPTTIFIDKKGKVRKIHTGFNGPATGEKYTEFKEEFEGFVAELLKE